MTEVDTQIPNRYEVRSRNTLKRLLAAAEEIFVRDGYAAAQLDEIASRAGRSKGAIYMHFKSKEELFLGLIEYRIASYIDHLSGHMSKCATRLQAVHAFRRFYSALAEDKAYHVLSLEFKLFALRHPEWKERYEMAFEKMKQPRVARYEQFVGRRSPSTRADVEASSLALGPIINSLVLESYFEPDLFSQNVLRQILSRVFDALITEL